MTFEKEMWAEEGGNVSGGESGRQGGRPGEEICKEEGVGGGREGMSGRESGRRKRGNDS